MTPELGYAATVAANAQRAGRSFATFSINGQPFKLPTSSSHVKTIVTPYDGVACNSQNVRSTSIASAQFAFMSKMPGP